jgi:hypothetical protein
MIPSLPAPIQQFVNATNAGQSDSFVDAFAEGGVLDDWGRVFTGREAIRGWDQTDNIGKNAHFIVDEVEAVSERDYRVTMTVSGGGFNGQSPFAFTLDGDLIARLVIR